MTTILAIVGGTYLLTLILAAWGGATIARQLFVTYGGPHEVREIGPHEVPQVPRAEYERAREQLQVLGFRSVGTLEDVTITRSNPALRTYIEVLVHESGTTYAACFYARDPKHPQLVVDLETWFEDGTFLVTTNGRLVGMLAAPESIVRNKVDPTAPLDHLWRRHQEAASEHGTRTHADPRTVDSLGAVLAAQRAFTARESEHRRALGYLTSEELRRLAAGVWLLPGALAALEWALRRKIAAFTRGAVC